MSKSKVVDKCREAFERDYSKKFPEDKSTRLPSGNYSGWVKQVYWEAWQSRQPEIDAKNKRIEEALFQMSQQALSLKEDCDGYKDPVGICQSEGIYWCVRFLEKVLRG